jgi:DNA 3'-phosphatase
MSVIQEYSPNWKDLGSVLVYQSDGFPFHNRLIITDFEGCLIEKISSTGMYHAINPKSIEPYNEMFLKQIKHESVDKSIVILSNQVTSNKLNIDMIKRKIEAFEEAYKIPILAFFALKPNKFSKPHTGMFKLLSMYFRNIGSSQILRAAVVSDFGGRVMESTNKKGIIKTKYDSSDVDRAFANNTGLPYMTINEYLKNTHISAEEKPFVEKFCWSKKYLDPEVRVMYLDKLAQYRNPNIFEKMATVGEVTAYMIIIYGAPRSGKTTLARDILKKWRKSAFGKKFEIHRLGLDNYTKGKRLTQTRKFLADRISVIIDGECHTDTLRQPFIDIAKEAGVPVFYIEVNCGMSMSYLFNHVAVEKAPDEATLLYPERDYHIYTSIVKRPPDTILYCPTVKKTIELMNYRY